MDWKSENWWVAIITVIAIPFVTFLGATITVNDILLLVIPVMAYIIGMTVINYQLPDITGKAFYLSKKWWTIVVTIIITILNKFTTINLDVEAVVGIILVVVTFVLGQSIQDVKVYNRTRR